MRCDENKPQTGRGGSACWRSPRLWALVAAVGLAVAAAGLKTTDVYVEADTSSPDGVVAIGRDGSGNMTLKDQNTSETTLSTLAGSGYTTPTVLEVLEQGDGTTSATAVDWADNATTAQVATTATYATSAGSADTATTATNADNATTAAYALDGAWPADTPDPTSLPLSAIVIPTATATPAPTPEYVDGRGLVVSLPVDTPDPTGIPRSADDVVAYFTSATPTASPTASPRALYDDGVLRVPSGGGSGDVTGPASSTDQYLALFDGTTGKAIQMSGIWANLTDAILYFTSDAKYNLDWSDGRNLEIIANNSPRLVIGVDYGIQANPDGVVSDKYDFNQQDASGELFRASSVRSQVEARVLVAGSSSAATAGYVIDAAGKIRADDDIDTDGSLSAGAYVDIAAVSPTPTPSPGRIWHNSADNKLYGGDGSNWNALW